MPDILFFLWRIIDELLLFFTIYTMFLFFVVNVAFSCGHEAFAPLRSCTTIWHSMALPSFLLGCRFGITLGIDVPDIWVGEGSKVWNGIWDQICAPCVLVLLLSLLSSAAGSPLLQSLSLRVSSRRWSPALSPCCLEFGDWGLARSGQIYICIACGVCE